jgi:tRNA pseudouridine38-40 synthase
LRNIKLTIEYDGTDYSGWQIQNKRKERTIQEAIEKTLRKILQDKIKLIGAGRTDAGVHAKAQVANFKTNSKLSLGKLQKALNGELPEDISIVKAEEKGLNFHSRFNAKSKVYRYIILNRAYPSALLRNTVYFYSYTLNIQLMRQGAAHLLGKHDFKSFCVSASSAKNTVRTIKRINIKKMPYDLRPGIHDLNKGFLICIDIEADGFLYNMTRNIVGTLLEIGRGKLAPDSLKETLMSCDRRLAGPTAPAKGLCLMQVKYKRNERNIDKTLIL